MNATTKVVLLAAVVVLAALLTILVASKRDLSSLESAQFQLVLFAAGLLATYLIGGLTGGALRTHARKAFRRLLNLYASQLRLAEALERRRSVLEQSQVEGRVELRYVSAAIDLLEAQVTEQLSTTQDALEDWRDVVPDEVQKVEEHAKRKVKDGTQTK